MGVCEIVIDRTAMYRDGSLTSIDEIKNNCVAGSVDGQPVAGVYLVRTADTTPEQVAYFVTLLEDEGIAVDATPAEGPPVPTPTPVMPTPTTPVQPSPAPLQASAPKTGLPLWGWAAIGAASLLGFTYFYVSSRSYKSNRRRRRRGRR